MNGRGRRVTSTLLGLACLMGAARAQTTPVIVWGNPAEIPYGQPLSAVQLNATATVSGPVTVPLAGVFNVEGIVTDGTTFSGGLDGQKNTYSATQLSGSVVWNGVTFPLGPPNQPNAVYGATITLPAGNYASLQMLGTAVNNPDPATATFTVTYTDGSTTSATPSFSDWVFPKNYAGESLVSCGPYRDVDNGTQQSDAVCLYGYPIALDPTKTVKTLTMPSSRSILMLSMALVTPAVPGTITYSPPVGTILPTVANTLTATFTPSSPANFNTARASVPLSVIKLNGPVTPVINWPPPAGVLAGTGLSGTQLDATASLTDSLVQVPLFAQSRIEGISTDGQVFTSSAIAGDVAYSNTALRGGFIPWNGTDFLLGPPDVPDLATSVAIPLPPGAFGALKFLAAAVTAQTAQTFFVSYTDGTLAPATFNMSAWTQSSGYPGETLVLSTNYADTGAGGTVGGVFNVYGYQVALDPTKTAALFTMPANAAIGMFALGLDPQLSAPVAGSFVYTPASGTVLPAGTVPLYATFSPLDTNDLATTMATNSIIVTGYALGLTANNATRVYGTPNPVLTGSITGAVGQLPVTESFSTTAVTLSPAGQYPIVPSVTGNNLAPYVQTIVDGTLTVTQAHSSLTLGVSQPAIYQAQNESLTANVLSATTGTPTGAINFFNNGTLLTTAPLVNGVATVNTTALPPGVNLITATYAGDNNFVGSSSVGSSSITVTGLDFSLQALNGSTLTTVTGGTPTLTLQLTPLYGSYPAMVQFTVSGALPLEAAYGFSPATVAANGGAVPVVLTLYSHKLSRAEPPALGRGWRDGVALAALLLLPLAMRARRLCARMMLVALALGALVSLNGCGWGYADEKYPFTVTATSGGFQHSLNLEVHILASGP